MSRFNFGEDVAARPVKKRVGIWEHALRSKTPIEEPDIEDIAWAYFADQLPLTTIAEWYNVGSTEIFKIVTGGNFRREWAKAIGELVSHGIECVRGEDVKEMDKEATSSKIKIPRLDAAQVKEIRRMFLNGATIAMICHTTGYKHYRVRAVVKNERFKGAEYNPPGWKGVE
jgi:hypothetical protein